MQNTRFLKLLRAHSGSNAVTAEAHEIRAADLSDTELGKRSPIPVTLHVA